MTNPFASLVSLLAPFECLGCDAEGRLLCPACTAALPVIEHRCYKCLAPALNFRTCQSCRSTAVLSSVQPVTLYDGLSKALILKFKFGRAQAAAREVAAIMADRLGFDPLMSAPASVILTHTPTATSRVRQRGYDQSQLIARALAKRSGIPYRRLLSRYGQSEQVGASKQLRRKQLRTAYYPVAHGRIRGNRVILVDDVCTTGSSLEAAAQVLLDAGADRVDGLVFAKA